MSHAQDTSQAKLFPLRPTCPRVARRAMSLRDAQRDVQMQLYGCADWSKEHSGDVWLAILRMSFRHIFAERIPGLIARAP